MFISKKINLSLLLLLGIILIFFCTGCAFNANATNTETQSKLTIQRDEPITRDLSDLDIYINLPHATGKITKIIYDSSTTQLIIDWSYDDQYLASISDFDQNHKITIEFSENMEFYQIKPLQVGADAGERTFTYNLKFAVETNEEIKINMYQQENGKPLGDFEQTLAIIPPHLI